MSTRMQTQQEIISRPAFTRVLPGLLQRACVCGGAPGVDGECAECRKKRLIPQRVALPGKQSAAAPRLVQDAPGLHHGYHFGNVRVHPVGQDVALGGPVHTNGVEDPEPLDEEEPFSGQPGEELPGQLLPSGVEESFPIDESALTPGALPLQAGGTARARCPSKTVVEKTIDITPAGIKKGYRTGYGAVAVMKVEPDSTNWDGAKIVESFKQTKSDCPKEFNISPCSGSSTFTVGAEANSSVLGKLPATSNRFYDTHYTRWNKGSLLHDRNPNNLNACTMECAQTYACGGNAIGKHTITRTFTKGTSGSRDVTLVAVTKK